VGFATPEEAARGDVAAENVHVVGVVIRGDAAVVMQITNANRYPNAYEVDTAQCYREAEGWVCLQSGNGNAGYGRDQAMGRALGGIGQLRRPQS
jgi:hypothetical protein